VFIKLLTYLFSDDDDDDDDDDGDGTDAETGKVVA